MNHNENPDLTVFATDYSKLAVETVKVRLSSRNSSLYHCGFWANGGSLQLGQSNVSHPITWERKD